MRAGAAIRVGCSGWQYRHWKGDFYPVDLPASGWLDYYARHFDTVEVNNSFYRLPEKGVFAAWRARTPANFAFAVKASRYLTHMKKLRQPQEPLDRLFRRAAELGPQLGPVLYQLPRTFRKDVERLSVFLDALPPEGRHVIEFRDSSWYDAEVLDLLRRRGVALCLHDMPEPPPLVVTAAFTYVRFHGASGAYGGAYGLAALREWARRLRSTNCPAWVYFNNDIGGHAPRNAVQFRAMF